MIINDPVHHTGARVNLDERLEVSAVSESVQHFESHKNGQAYQVIGTATIAAATTPILHIKNTDPNRILIVSYIRAQIVDPAGGTAIPAATTYWTLSLDRTYSSGGAAATPVNMNSGSGNNANVTAYTSGPTLTGTGTEFDREYIKSEAELTKFNKEGALIIAPNGTFELSLASDHTSGTAYARISFMMADKA